MNRLLADAGLLARTATAIGRAGVLTATRPGHLLPALRAYLDSGASLATITALAAVHAPDTPAVIDERGPLSYAQLRERTTAIAGALRTEYGLGSGSTVGVLCRNHRGFVLATVAAARLGADVVLLNTEFSGPQLRTVLERHRPDVVIADEEYLPLLDGVRTVLAWHEGDPGEPTLDALTGPRPPRPRGQGRITLLTSGTTGTPKGAPRSADALAFAGPLATILDRGGLRLGDPVLVAPPLFHGFGFAMFGLAAFLRSPIVLRRKFDAAATVAALGEHRIRCLAVVPAMLHRILALPREDRDPTLPAGLRCVLSGAAPLPPALATRALDELGEVLCNGYGSSEIGIAAIAGPADLRAAPATVGRPTLGVPVAILDEHGKQVPEGEIGTVHVGGRQVFGGYTGGGSKGTVRGLMSTGDRGHFDREGRLYIDGRADDMIVSGGENVYPQEVEDVLSRHQQVGDAAVLGVADEEFGQRLVAYVVAEPGHAPTEEELRQHVRDNLARYKVPRAVVFLDQLPRNPTGKLLRRELPRA
ncbi:AMP-binding protein [Amycolatopsis cihanbeyliensis]|uniref:Acyl-CoA synthetase (AMP-forming)/AMP-acid ligase II n=1 Tax=Amycolatopsis cihanbeyliensis TaxID=1128664 RepID=A0A542DQK6_AMYCI|nr:AMP-binding protein [Amycolatopsis cihanbeyliensis]TQJ05347.1 acyl-CoA synthetase (AMP-forming)/AMP-acid ligase II [Amycolatopsis cihanbeyliensis]